MSNSKAFTLIEVIITLLVVTAMSMIVLFSIRGYVDRGKDTNIEGNLAVLIPAGEAYYNIGNTYGDPTGTNFCNSQVVLNAINQMPENPDGACASANSAGLCCNVNDFYSPPDNLKGTRWMACATKFSDPEHAFCVDSMGTRTDISVSLCEKRNAYVSCSRSYQPYPLDSKKRKKVQQKNIKHFQRSNSS